MTNPLDEGSGGLRFDLATMGRRRALIVLGGSTLALLTGCGADDGGGARSTTTSRSGRAPTGANALGSSGDCATIPEETAGPFPGNGTNGPDVLTEEGVVRSDIRSSFGSASGTANGVPLTFHLDLLDSAGCAPLAGAAVYAWQCDREGRYSLYSEGAENANYLRGVQETDTNGRASFKSIFPGAYPGRWPHIHFEVYASLAAANRGGRPIATSQIALPGDACNAAYKASGYEESARSMRRTTLQNDILFSDDAGEQQLGTASGSVSAGFTVALRAPVDSD